MPADQETRIVEMRFDNRDFERNIKKSSKSLEDFKKELKFEETSKGLREFTSSMNTIDFHGLTSNIQRLTDKFTGLGDAGEWVLSRIRHGIESAMVSTENFLKSFTTAQVSVGQGKYDALNKAVQALIATGKYTEKQAYQVFERVMEYTDQTSANFQTMVDQIATFTSTGRGLQESERAMEGIFNMTAKAGKGATEASAAMNTFSKAMGQGFLGYEQWNSLNLSAHIITEDFRNVILETAVATGDLVKKQNKYYTNGKKYGKQMEVTAQNLQNTLSKKWLSKDTMMAVFDKYYFAKLTGATEEELESFAGVAYKSAQRALTFADAMNAIKESVSSGWMQSFRLIFGDVTEAMEFFTNLCERVIEGIEGIKEARNAILRVWSRGSGGGRQALIETILGDYGKSVETGAFGLLDLFDSIGSIISEGFWEMAKIFAQDENFTLGNWDKEGFKEAWLGRQLRDFTKNIRDFVASIKTFFTEEVKVGEGTKTRIQMVGDIVAGIGAALALGWDIMQGVFHFINGLRGQLQDTIDTVRDFFARLSAILYDTAEETHRNKNIIEFFDELLKVTQPITSAINTVVAKLSEMLLAFIKWGVESGAFASAMTFVTNAIKKIGDIVNKVGRPIFDFFGRLFSATTELFKSGFNTESVEKFKVTMLALFKDTKNKLKAFVKSMNLKGVFTNVYGIVTNFFKTLDVPKLLLDAWSAIKKFFKNVDVKALLSGVVSKVKEFLKKVKFKDSLNDIVGNISKDLPGVFGKIIEKIKAFFSKIGNPFEGSGSIFEKIIEYFKAGYNKAKKFFSEIDFSKGFSGVFDKLKETFVDADGNFKKMDFAKVLGTIAGVVFGSSGVIAIVKKIKASKNGIAGAVATVSETVAATKKAVRLRTILSIVAAITTIGSLIYILNKVNFAEVFGKVKEITKGIDFGKALQEVFNFLKRVFTDIGNWLKTADVGSILRTLFQVFAGVEILRMIRAARYTTNEVGYLIENLSKKIKGKSLGSKFKKFATSIMEMAIAIGIISYSIKMIGEMNPEDLTRGGLVVAGSLVALTVIGKAFKKDKLPSGSSAIGLAATVYALGLAIEKIAKALLPYAKMEVGDLLKPLTLVLAIFVPLVMISKQVSWFDKDRSGGLKGLAFLVGAIALLLGALLPYSLIPWPNLFKMAVSLVGLLGILTVFAAILKKIKVTSAELKGLAATAAGIAILVLALIPLSFIDWPNLLRMGAGLLGIMTMLLIFTGLLKKFQLSTAKLAGVITLSVSIGLIGLLLLPLALIPWEGLAKMGVSLVVIMGSIVAIAATIGKLKVSKGQMVSVLAVAGSIVLLALTLIPLSLIKKEDLIKAGKALAGVAVIIAALVWVSSKSQNADKVGKQILGIAEMAVSAIALIYIVNTITEALRRVRDIPESMILTFVGGISLLMAVMAGVIITLGNIPIATGLKGILLISGAILAISLVLSVAIPAFLDAVGSSITDFTSKMVLVADMMEQFSTRISTVDEGGIEKADGLIDKFKNLLTKIIVMGIMDYKTAVSNFTTAIYDLSTGLEIFQNHTASLTDPSNNIAFKMVDQLILASNSLAGFTIGNFADEVYNLGLGLYAFDYLGKDMGDPQYSKPLVLLTELAGCAEDLKTLSTLGLDELKSQLAGLGGAMSLYAEGAKEVTGIEGDQTTNVQGAVGIMAAITKAFSEEGGLKLPEIPHEAELGSFGADLAALAGAIVKFTNASEGIGESTDRAIMLLDFLGGDLKQKLTSDNLASANAFKDAGITPYSLTSFGLEIIGLGTAIASFADSTQNINQSKLDNATNALTFFSNLRSTLVGQDSIMSLINAFLDEDIQPTQMETFGKNIEQLGLSLAQFATSVSWSQDKEDGVNNAIKSLQSLSGIETELSKITIGGLKSIIVGRSKDLGDVAGEMVTLGNAFVEFSNAVSGDGTETKPGINVTAMTDALGVLDLVVDFLGNGENGLQTKMGKVEGVLQKFTGEHNYNAGNLKTDIDGLSASIAEVVKCSDILNGTDPENPVVINEGAITKALGTLDTMTTFVAGLQEKMPKVDGLQNILKTLWNGGDYKTENLKTDMGNIGQAIGDFSTGIGANFNPDSVNAAVGVVGVFAEILRTLATINGEDYNSAYEYIDALKNLLKSMNGGEMWYGEDVAGAVTGIVHLMEMISKAVEEGSGIKAEDINMFTQMAISLKHLSEIDPTFNFVSVGESIATGVATGIQNASSSVTIAARAMAMDAYWAAMNALNASSPSKLFQEVGGFITAGMSKGINEGSGEVQNSIIDMSQDTLMNATTVLGLISQLLSEELEVNPTITPVLDLTNLSNGVGTINDLLDHRGMTINAGLASQMAATNIPTSNRPEINQNSTDYSGIYERMNALGQTVASLGEQIAQMKIVLDSGVIAGAVTDAVDTAIGAKAFYAGRGN